MHALARSRQRKTETEKGKWQNVEKKKKTIQIEWQNQKIYQFNKRIFIDENGQ